MIFQGFLLIALVIVFLYALSQHKRAPFVSMIIAISSVVGIGFVVWPDLATTVAHSVGIGRGADLILYCFVIVALVAIFNIHLRLRSEAEIITELVRRNAITEAKSPRNVQ